MDFKDYEVCGESADSYWWFAGKNKLVLDSLTALADILPKNPLILDIGCGRGEMLEKLGRIGYTVAIDNSENLHDCRNPHNGHIIQCDGMSLCFKDNVFDLAVMLDILEHFEDDLGALSRVYEKLKPGGYLLVTVPAVPSLYGHHDRMLDHFRRYSRKTLEQLISKTGFKIERITHWNAFLYLPIFLIRILKKRFNNESSDIFNFPPKINEMLTWIIYFESFLINRGITLPFGINLLAVLRK